MTGTFVVAGEASRTPGDYHRPDSRTGEPTKRLLRDTNEYIHASVRTRYVLRGPGYGDRGDYDPKALRRWKLVSEQREDLRERRYVWEQQDGNGIALPEAPLRAVERMLLQASPEADGYIVESAAIRRSHRR